MSQRPFNSIYTHRFIRAAVCIPRVRVAEPAFNAEHTLGLARRFMDAGRYWVEIFGIEDDGRTLLGEFSILLNYS